MTPVRWDLTSFFPSFDSPERSAFEAELRADTAALLGETSKLGAIGEASDDAWESAVVRFEGLLARLSHFSSYVTCLASADANDDRFVLAEGRLNLIRADFEKLSVELRRALRSAPEPKVKSFIERPKLAGAKYFVERAREESRTSMAPELEGLAADLGADGIMGWGRLYDTVSAKLRFNMRSAAGKVESLPVAQRRSLMADPVRSVREEAFRAGNEAWATVADVCAAALNHIAGTRHVLYGKRRVGHFLDIALRDAAISEKTLNAMLEAVKARAEVPRRGLRIKARAMGVDAIQWCDLEAPLPLAGAERIPWDKGVGLVRSAFDRGFPRLAQYFESMLATRWIEAEPRDGKRPGAYCTHSDLTGETRVFMTYQGSLGDVSTLAHEVGHAFHADVIRRVRVLGRQYPMTLAETASTFAESLLSDGLLSDASLSKETRALLLNEAVSDGASFLLDIPTRFYFEKRFYEERRSGELPAARISELMVEAQREVFGDTLARGGEDPLFWASKLHFFIPDVSFYNFPYTFGFLLSRGLSALYRAEGKSFLPRYERFLELTGSGPAHEVAKASIGRDLETPEFWAEAIDTLVPPTDELERLLPSVLPVGGTPPEAG